MASDVRHGCLGCVWGRGAVLTLVRWTMLSEKVSLLYVGGVRVRLVLLLWRLVMWLVVRRRRVSGV